MTREDFHPGDLVQVRGYRLVLGPRSLWGRTPELMWGVMATKAGKADRRFEGGSIMVNETTLIKRGGAAEVPQPRTKPVTRKKTAAPKKPPAGSLDDVVVLVIGDRCWGKAATLDDALQRAFRPKKYQVFLTHKTTYVDDMGYVMFNSKFAPREILRKGIRPGQEFFKGQEDEPAEPKKARND